MSAMFVIVSLLSVSLDQMSASVPLFMSCSLPWFLSFHSGVVFRGVPVLHTSTCLEPYFTGFFGISNKVRPARDKR